MRRAAFHALGGTVLGTLVSILLFYLDLQPVPWRVAIWVVLDAVLPARIRDLLLPWPNYFLLDGLVLGAVAAFLRPRAEGERPRVPRCALAAAAVMAIVGLGWLRVEDQARVHEYYIFHGADYYEGRRSANRLLRLPPEIWEPALDRARAHESTTGGVIAHETYHRLGHPRARGMLLPALVDCPCDMCVELRAHRGP